MPKYLLTGATGFLGRHIQDWNNIHGVKFVTLSEACGTDHKVDISKPFEFDIDVHFDTVIHAAGKAHSIPKTETQKQEFFTINYEGTKNLCLAIDKLKNKPRALIFISTVSVYGLDSGEDISEEYPLAGVTPYAMSKILAEEFLLDWAKVNDIKLSILRLPLIAGKNPPGNLGAMVKGIKSGRYLSIGKAEAKKSIVWAADIAALMPVAAKKGGTYNLTGGYNPTLAELENCISAALNKKMPLRIPFSIIKIVGYIGDLLGERFPINTDKIKKLTSTLTFDDSLAVKELGWKPTPVLTNLSSIL